MAEPTRGLLDTSVVVDHDLVDPALLPDESAIAALTLAELAAGPHATDEEEERARRQEHGHGRCHRRPMPRPKKPPRDQAFRRSREEAACLLLLRSMGFTAPSKRAQQGGVS
jgi:hypothetical protein